MGWDSTITIVWTVGRLLAVVATGLAFASPAQALTKQDLRLTMSDGAQLAATLYLPDGAPPAQGWPAIMAFHGLGQTRASLAPAAETVFAPSGYAVLTVDARGHGQSGGLNDLDGPRSIADVRELYQWLAARPDVSDTAVGAFGVSLGGGAVWRAAAEGVPFAAIVPLTTWTDLYSALYPGNLAKSGAVLTFLSEIPAERFAPVVTALHDDLLHSTNLQQVRGLAAERSVAGRFQDIHAPALLIQGRRDFPFDIAQALLAFRRVSAPVRLYLGDLGHPPAANPPAELPFVLTLARRWFDRWLKGLPNGAERPRVELAADPWSGRTFGFPGLPRTSTARYTFGGRRTIREQGKVARTLRLPRRRLETFGAPVVRVRLSSATGWPRVVAVLSALTSRGEVVVAAGGAQTPQVGRSARDVTLRLTNQATPIPAGSRLRITLASSSTAQSPGNLLYLPFPFGRDLRLTVGRVKLSLPILRRPVSR
jgi:predicted acyl esterase